MNDAPRILLSQQIVTPTLIQSCSIALKEVIVAPRISVRYVGILVALALLGSQQDRSALADDDEVNAILDRAIDALGGEKKLTDFKATWKSKGMILDDPVDAEITVDGLNRYRLEFRRGEYQGVFLLNDDKCWWDLAGILTKTNVASAKRKLYLEMIPVTILPLKSMDFKVEKVGDEVLKIIGPDEKEFTLYFDKKSGLPAKVAAVWSGGAGVTRETSTFRDYKLFDGVQKATTIVTSRNGEFYREQTITEFKLLKKVEPDRFALALLDAATSEEALAKIINSPDPDGARLQNIRLEQYLRSQPRETLTEMKFSERPEVASLCAWHLLVTQRTDRIPKVGREDMLRFVGFMERAHRLSLERWWVDSLLQNHCLKPRYSEPPDLVHVPAPIMQIPGALVVNKKEIKLDAKPNDSMVTAILSDHNLLVAQYDGDNDGPYTLTCFDVRTGLKKWTAPVYASGYSGGVTTGPGVPHHVKILCRDDEVIVVGAGESGNYLERFELTTGKPVYRFSTLNYAFPAPK